MTPAISRLALERACLAVWRAREDEERHGWRLLAENGVTGRVNALWPLAWTGEVSLNEAIDAAETWYLERGLPPCFKLSDGAFAPADLPAALAARGYAPHTETLVMTAPAALAATAVAASVTLQADPAGAFGDVLVATATSRQDLAERRAIIARAPSPKAFAIAAREGQSLAVGMTAVAPSGLAGIFAMRTDPAARRQGLAQAILAELAAFAASHGAHALFLQVEAANAPAIALYEKMGFATAYAYRFWKRP